MLASNVLSGGMNDHAYISDATDSPLRFFSRRLGQFAQSDAISGIVRVGNAQEEAQCP
jgi:hypothetical protein